MNRVTEWLKRLFEIELDNDTLAVLNVIVNGTYLKHTKPVRGEDEHFIAYGNKTYKLTEWCGVFKKIEQLYSGKCLSSFTHSAKKIISKELEKKNREWNKSVIVDMEKEK